MQTILGNYQSGYSAWQIPLIVYHCNDQDNQTYVDNCLSGLTMNSPSCAPYKDMMWKLFRAMYLAKKQQLMESRFGGCNSTQLSTIINAYGKTRRHYAPADAGNLAGGTTGTGASDKAKADHKDQCESLCESYADVWMQQLSACDFTGLGSDPEVIKENLRASLIGVCVNGCDMKSPIGASDVATEYLTDPSVVYKSFQGVVKGIMGTHFVPGQCDANLISFPSGYAHDYLATTNPYADTCACSHVPAPKADTACVCTEPSADLKTSILANIGMPEEYKCKTCISCDQLFGALRSIDLEYTTYVSDASFKQRKVLESLFNKYLNFNLTYEEYQSFMAGCL